MTDLTEIFKKYKNEWVALSDDEETVISHDKKAKIAYDKALKKGYKNPIMFKVPEKSILYVGYEV